MMEVPRKYRGLRWIGLIASLVAWVVLLLMVVALLTMTANVGMEWARWVLGGTLVLWGIFTFLQLFVVGNVLLLLNDVEQQSRAHLTALERLEALIRTPKPTETRGSAMVVDEPAPAPTLRSADVITPAVEPPPVENKPSESKPQTV
jgi:cytochrome c biogenesis protein CcdA